MGVGFLEALHQASPLLVSTSKPGQNHLPEAAGPVQFGLTFGPLDGALQPSIEKTRLSEGLWGGIGRGLHARLSYRGKTCPAGLVQKHRTSWRRNLDSLVTSVVADGIRWVSRALGKRLRFQVYLLFWDQGRISLCRPERLFPNKRPALSTLRDGCISIMRPMSGVGCRQLLLFSPMLQCVLAGLCEVLNAVEENVQLAVTGVPSPFSSVHHGSHSLPASSSSPLLLLPLFFLRSLSSNSLAIQKPRCDLNAVSSTMKRISSEHGVCHLRC